MARPWERYGAGSQSIQTKPTDPTLPLVVEGKQLDNAGKRADLAGLPVERDIARTNLATSQTNLQIKQAELREKAASPDVERQKLWAARDKARGAISDIAQARALINDKSTGLLAKPLGFLGGTDATGLQGLLDKLKGNFIMDKLMEMKAQSPNGASGLGALSDTEAKYLAATVAALDPNMPKELLAAELAKAERHYKRFALSLEGVNPDSYKTDPFDMLEPDVARERAQQMIRAGADEKTVSEFLRVQDMQYEPGQLQAVLADNQRAQVRPGPRDEVLAGIQKGVEHVGSRAAEGVQAVPNALLGTNFDFGTDWRKSMEDRFSGVYTDPSGETLGRFLGVLPTALIPNPFTAGAVAGGLAGDARDPQGVAGETMLGGVGGVAADKAFRLAGGLLSPRISPGVRAMHNRGDRMTPGQIIGGEAQRAEGLRTTLPFAGPRIERQLDQSLNDFTYGVQDEVLGPIGKRANRTIAPGNQGVADTSRKVGAEYDRILAQTGYEFTPGFGQRMLGKLGSRKLRPDVASKLAETIETELGNTFAKGMRVTGREWKGLDEQLGKIAADYAGEGGVVGRQAASAIRDMKRDLFSDFVRQNGKQAAAIRQADRSYQRLNVYRRAAIADKANGTPTPMQVLNAATAEAPAGRVAVSEGRAPLQAMAQDAQGVLQSGLANSRTAERSIAANPITHPFAFTQGAALAPLYSEPVQRAIQNILLRQPGQASQAAGNAIHALPTGARGMFGSSAAPRVAFGNDGAYDKPISDEDYRRFAW